MKKFDGRLPILHRTVEADVQVVKRAEDGSPTLYDISVSSEAEVTRWFGVEVLDHSRAAVDMSRMKSGAGVLIDHASDQVGVVQSARLDEGSKRLRASVQFSRSARGKEVEQDVADGIRRNVSIGYRVMDMKLVEQRGDVPVYRITRWMPVEVSFVGVPADPTVGVGRSDDAGEQYPVNLDDGAAVEEEQMQHRKLDSGGAGGSGGSAPEKPVVTVDNRKDILEIMEVCEANGLGSRASEWIRAGHDINAVMKLILAERKSNGKAQAASDSVEAIAGTKEAKQYSYARAILQANDNGSDGNYDGFEGEIHRELLKRSPAGAKYRGGILIPMRVRDITGEPVEKRTLDSKTIGKGVELVPDIQQDLIELLRNRTYVLQLGARLLTGLSQPLSFPRQTGPIVAQWVAENPGANVGASDPALGLGTLIPKTLQATTGYSRQFLNSATIDVEGWIRDELATVHGIAIDRAAIHGAGANGEPTGIYKQTGTGTEPFAGVVQSLPHLINMQTAVANANALMGSIGYLTSPTVAGRFKQTLDFAASAAGRPIWDGPFSGGTIGGYQAFATNQVSSTMSTNEPTGGSELGVVFGNWMDMIIGMFASMEIIVDPYSQKKQGLIEVTSFQMADVLLRHPESFSKSNGAT